MTYHERYPLTTLAGDGEARADTRLILVDFLIAVEERNRQKTDRTWPDLSDIYTETIERLREAFSINQEANQ